jgi:hypothetical protein
VVGGDATARPPAGASQRRRVSSWIRDNALNCLAYVALRMAPPLRARLLVERVAGLGTVPVSADEARAMMKRLGNRGTCLSRSLAVAARCPGSHVVIGVMRPPAEAGTWRQKNLEAHAWVEIKGEAVNSGVERPWAEIGRIHPPSG